MNNMTLTQIDISLVDELFFFQFVIYIRSPFFTVNRKINKSNCPLYNAYKYKFHIGLHYMLSLSVVDVVVAVAFKDGGYRTHIRMSRGGKQWEKGEEFKECA